MGTYIQRLFTHFGHYVSDTLLAALDRNNHFRLDTNTRKLFWSNNSSWLEVANGVGINETLGNVELRPSGLIGEGHFDGITQQGSVAGLYDLDASGYWMRLISAASNGALGGFTHSASILNAIRRSFDGWMTMRYQIFSTDMPLTDPNRFIFGVWDSTSIPVDSDTLLANDRSGFFIAYRPAVDTNYMILYNDGTGAMQTYDTGLQFPATSTVHRVEIQWSPTEGFRWVIANIGETALSRGSINTRIPATTTRVYMVGGVQGLNKSILMRGLKCKVGGH